ncbi:MAG: diguanylate cyclase [Pseudomonadota bacterium]
MRHASTTSEPRGIQLALELGVCVLAIWVTIWLSYAVGFVGNTVVAIWPAGGLGVWMALRYGWRAVPCIALGQGLHVLMTFPADQLVAGLLPSATNAIAIGIAISLYRRYAESVQPLYSLRTVTLFFLIPGVLHSVIASVAGTSIMIAFFDVQGAARWEIAWRWFFSDFTGVVLIAPFMMAVEEAWLSRRSPSAILNRDLASATAITIGVLALIAIAATQMPDALGQYPIVLFTMPLCIWLAFKESSITSLSLLAASILGALGLTLLRVGDVSAAGFLVVQLYGVVVMCTSLVLHANSRERRQALADLASERASLERTVAERTAALQDQIAAYELVKAELEKQASTDSLTDLANRRAFMSHLDEQFAKIKRNETSQCLVMIDLDHFKTINDTHGHAVGDEVLEQVGTILRDSARTGMDFPARLGGEEFACLLDDTSLEGGVIAARRLLQRIEEAVVKTTAGPLSFTASAGLAPITGQLPSIHHAMVAADEALYEAKRSGRNQVCTHDPLTITISLKVAQHSSN